MTVLRTAALFVGLSMVLLGGCNGTDDGGQRALFGNGLLDNSRVVARVDGEPITESMLELRLEEMGNSERSQFTGEEGRRLLVRLMVEEMLHARQAEQQKLDVDPVVAQVLIAQYRKAMEMAHRNDLARGIEPSVDQVREHYESNRERYQKLGRMQALHIQTSSRDKAMKAYREIADRGRAFATVCHEYSENKTSVLEAGNLGWFNKGGFIPAVTNGKAFTEVLWELDLGLNEPIEFDGKWHVVEVTDRQLGRQQTLDEAYVQVATEVTPVLQQAAVRKWLVEAKTAANLEFYGEFQPGLGKTPRELLDRALAQANPADQAQTFRLLIQDFPDDELTDDALFLAANLHLDEWGDVRQAGSYLASLLRRFPNSDYAEDAEYIIKNMNKPSFQNPGSIEDLRRD